MPGIQDLSDQELAALAGGGSTGGGDITSLSDDELMQLAGGSAAAAPSVKGQVSLPGIGKPSLIGMAKSAMSAFKLPGDVLAGKVDPLSEEGLGRARELATFATPLPPGMRAGEGVLAAPQGVRRAVPTEEALGQAVDKGYGTARDMGVPIPPTAVRDMTQGAESALLKKFGTEGPASDTLGALRAEGARRAPIEADPMAALTKVKPATRAPATIAEMEDLRQQLGTISQNAGAKGSERLSTRIAQGKIDDMLAEHGGAAAPILKDARANAHAKFKSETVSGKIELGELNAATGHGNTAKSLEQAIKGLIRPDNKGVTLAEKMGFTPPQIAQMNRIARKGQVGKVASWVGKLAPVDAVRVYLNAHAAINSGGLSLPITAAASVGRYIGGRSTRKEVEKLSEMVRADSPLGRQGAPIPQGMLSQLGQQIAVPLASQSLLSLAPPRQR